ncbi:MAG: hypothetical protein ACQERX_04825 [Bacillota bacterium]
MENLKKLTVKLTQETVDNLESKYYANGNEKKVGDLVLYVMLIEDDSKEHKNYHCLPINFDDLGREYKFTGKYFDENNTTSEFHFPIVEGKFTQPKVTSLKEFNDYMKHFSTKKEECIELLEWLRTFKSLEKRENCWVLGHEISSEQLYDGYLNDRKQWRKQQK